MSEQLPVTSDQKSRDSMDSKTPTIHSTRRAEGAKLRLQIITPEKITYDGEVESVTIPGADGELGILSGHVGLVVPIVPGILHIVEKDDEKELAIGAGFAEVFANKIEILTDMVVSEETSETAASEAIQRAEEAMREKAEDGGLDPDAMAAALTTAVAQIRRKRK